MNITRCKQQQQQQKQQQGGQEFKMFQFDEPVTINTANDHVENSTPRRVLLHQLTSNLQIGVYRNFHMELVLLY